MMMCRRVHAVTITTCIDGCSCAWPAMMADDSPAPRVHDGTQRVRGARRPRRPPVRAARKCQNCSNARASVHRCPVRV